jgi:hypothetical protein
MLTRFATLALLLLARPLRAQAADMTADEAKDIHTLLHVSGGDSLGLQMGTYMANSIIDAVRKQMPDLPETKVETIKKVIGDVLKEEMPGLLEQLAPLYARYYTPDEIRQLIAFYESPLGVKMLRVNPMLLRESTAMGEQWGRALQPRLQKRLEKALADTPGNAN